MDNVDIDNLSTDMKLGGKLAFPVGSSKFTIKELLERYDADSLIGVGVDDAGTVMLYVENIFNYETRDLSKKFGTLVDSVLNFSVKTEPFALGELDNFDPTPGNGVPLEKDATMMFNFNRLNDDETVQELTGILFKKTTIKVNVNTFDKTYDPGFLVMTMQIPGTDSIIVIDASRGSFSENKTNLKMQINKNKTTDYNVNFKVTGDGSTTIAADAQVDVTIAFEDSEYVVYGYFYYNDGIKQMEPFDVNLFSYLPEGTDLRFYNPSIKFNVTSNIGIPFLFDLDTLTAHNHGESEPTHESLKMNENDGIKRATTLGDSTISTIVIDKSNFVDENKTLAMFKTSLESISAAYTFRALERDQLTDTTEQFIESGSYLRMTASAQLPFWLDTGSVIAYADTIADIDLSEANDYITSASLIFNYTSNLPIGFEVTIIPLDENKRDIAVASPDKYRYSIASAPVDGDGVVSRPLEGTFSIDYDKSIADEMGKAKHLVIKVKAKGFTPKSRIKITDVNGLEVKVELRAEGGIDYNGQ
jgi:hypothetical protein